MSLVTLYRGLRNESERDLILSNKTAGGKKPAINPTAPTEADMNGYKAKGTDGECYPPPKDAVILTNFTEYTSDVAVAKRFGIRSGYMAVITVDESYIRIFDPDPIEHGVLIRSDTPLASVEIQSAP